MIDMLLKEAGALGVLVPGNHAVLALLNQGLCCVRSYEAVEAAHDENHRDHSLLEGIFEPLSFMVIITFPRTFPSSRCFMAWAVSLNVYCLSITATIFPASIRAF